MENLNNSYKLKTFENVGYNALAKIVHLVFQGAANVILARNLASSDYGIAGFAMILTGFAGHFADIGMSTAILQPKELDEEGLYTGFVIKAAAGLGVFFVVVLFAPVAGRMFGYTEVDSLVRLLALNFVINAFSFLPNALITRSLDYKKLFVPQAVSIVVNSLLAIFMARAGYGYWSIIIANVCSTAVFAAALLFAHPVRIRFFFNSRKAAEFLRFGGTILITGLLAFTILNADNFLIGALKGAESLGYYALAFNWGSLVCVILGAVVSSVLFPTFSKFQEDRPRLKSAFVRVLGYVSFFGILVNSGLFAVSRDFLFIVLGRDSAKWLPALATLKILCVYGIVRLLFDPMVSALMAVGKARAILRAQFVVAGVELALLYPALKLFGIEGAALAVIIAYSFEYITLYPLAKRELGLSISEWAAPALPAAVAGASALTVLYGASGLLPVSMAGLVLKVMFFTLVYCLAHGILTGWRMVGELRETVSDLRAT